MPRFGTLNMHPGLLPEYRGLSSVFWAVLEGGEVGATLHFIDEGIDTGPIVARRSVPVLPGDTFERLRGRIIAANLDMLVDALRSLNCDGHLVATPQPSGAGRLYHVIPSSKRRAAEARLAALAASGKG
jgi:methionyl-tRNA formyltransferase